MNRRIFIVFFLGLVGVVSMGSAAVAFSAMSSVNPLMKSCWRLQITSLCFFIMVLLTYKDKKEIYKDQLKKYWKTILIAGFSIGAHFSLWNVSMQFTSIAHSLVFLYSCPALLVLYYMIRCRKLKLLQVSGAMIGFVGMFIMCFLSSSDEGTTWYGDLIALSGAVALAVNLIISENLMIEGPIFYLFCIHITAAVFCLVISISLYPISIASVFGYLYTLDGAYALYLGVVCGFIGNGALYFLLKYVSPFILSVIINFDPVVGSLFAWIFGFQSDPNRFTFIGGSLVLLGNFIATASLHMKKKNEEQKNENKVEPHHPLSRLCSTVGIQ
ncbi:hypothetical protein SteCoe_6474 [Stentor coeruleus]|uniref:EamA domain-containing protein n=1 Tax=Stentor coeruleus TaxID=5963 RepID=A0A1R2CPU2_9CILI|nr:hypothetical protein SteCoe_6474 [Stentor coeruleus]